MLVQGNPKNYKVDCYEFQTMDYQYPSFEQSNMGGSLNPNANANQIEIDSKVFEVLEAVDVRDPSKFENLYEAYLKLAGTLVKDHYNQCLPAEADAWVRQIESNPEFKSAKQNSGKNLSYFNVSEVLQNLAGGKKDQQKTENFFFRKTSDIYGIKLIIYDLETKKAIYRDIAINKKAQRVCYLLVSIPKRRVYALKEVIKGPKTEKCYKCKKNFTKDQQDKDQSKTKEGASLCVECFREVFCQDCKQKQSEKRCETCKKEFCNECLIRAQNKKDICKNCREEEKEFESSHDNETGDSLAQCEICQRPEKSVSKCQNCQKQVCKQCTQPGISGHPCTRKTNMNQSYMPNMSKQPDHEKENLSRIGNQSLTREPGNNKGQGGGLLKRCFICNELNMRVDSCLYCGKLLCPTCRSNHKCPSKPEKNKENMMQSQGMKSSLPKNQELGGSGFEDENQKKKFKAKDELKCDGCWAAGSSKNDFLFLFCGHGFCQECRKVEQIQCAIIKEKTCPVCQERSDQSNFIICTSCKSLNLPDAKKCFNEACKGKPLQNQKSTIDAIKVCSFDKGPLVPLVNTLVICKNCSKLFCSACSQEFKKIVGCGCSCGVCGVSLVDQPSHRRNPELCSKCNDRCCACGLFQRTLEKSEKCSHFQCMKCSQMKEACKLCG